MKRFRLNSLNIRFLDQRFLILHQFLIYDFSIHLLINLIHIYLYTISFQIKNQEDHATSLNIGNHKF